MKLVGWTLVAVALVSLAWFVARSSERTAVAEPGAAAKSGAPAKRIETPNPIAAETTHEARQVVGPNTPAPNASAVAKDLVALTVIARDTKQPIANAQIRVLVYGSVPDLHIGKIRNDFAVLERCAAEHGTKYVTDEHGSAAIARVADRGVVVASKDGLFGLVDVNPGASQLTIELAPDDELLVRAIDASGRPIGGIPLELTSVDVVVNAANESIHTTTALDDGVARIPHARFLVEGGQHHEFAVRAEIVSAEPVSSPIDLHRWPAPPIVLRLPPLGSVSVHVLDGHGEVRRARGQMIQLIAVRPNESGEALAKRMRFDALTLTYPVESCDFVAVGTELEARSSIESGGLATLAKRAPGPAAVGERIEIELGGRDAIAQLHGRVLDVDGRAMAKSTVAIEYGTEDARGSSSLGGQKLELDANGEYWWSVEPSTRQETHRTLELSHRDPDTGSESSATVHIDGPLDAGVKELGDLRLAAKRVLVDGLLVDEFGAPLAGARLHLLRPNSEPGARSSWTFSELEGQVTASSGKFAFLGEWRDSTLALYVEASGYVMPEPSALAVGSRDVRVVLERGGSVEGSVIVDDDAVLLDFGVSCAPQDAKGARTVSDALRSLPEPHRGSFKLGGLPPGKVRVTIQPLDGDVLAQIDDVVVVAGRASDDPRLNAIDLRGLSHAIQFVARKPDGEPVEFADVRVRARVGTREWRRVAAIAGRATIRLRSLPIDMVVAAPGFRTKRIDGVSADLDLKLEVGIPIELALDADSRSTLNSDSRSARAASALIAAALVDGRLTTIDDRAGADETQALDSQGRATLRLGEPGRYRPDIRLARLVDGQREWLTLDCTPVAIEVRDSTEVQKFDVALSPGELARAKAFLDG